MCLNTLCDRELKQSEKQGIGWKVFSKAGSGLVFEYKMFNDKSEVPVGRWLKAEHNFVEAYGFCYTSGFHVFRTRCAARNWKSNGLGYQCICKVKYRKVMYLGIQKYHEVLVVDEILVLPPRKKGN
jgi:hypothetical protein